MVEPTRLKNICSSNFYHIPKVPGVKIKKKYVSCHHLELHSTIKSLKQETPPKTDENHQGRFCWVRKIWNSEITGNARLPAEAFDGDLMLCCITGKTRPRFFVKIASFWFQHMEVSKNRGTPKWMVKIMEHPIKMGWFGGTIIFGNIQIWRFAKFAKK